MMRKLFSLLLLLSCFWSPAVFAETSEQTEVKTVKQQEVPRALRSPRATMGSFLRAMNDVKQGKSTRIEDAIKTLDLEELNPLIRVERGSVLAWMLLEVIDRTRYVRFNGIPDYTEGDSYVFHHYYKGSIVIDRVHDGRWLFTQATLKTLPELHEFLLDKPLAHGVEENTSRLPFHLKLRRMLPDGLKRDTFLLENWQWLGLLLPSCNYY